MAVTAASLAACLVVLGILASGGSSGEVAAPTSPRSHPLAEVVVPNVAGFGLSQASSVLGSVGLRVDTRALRAQSNAYLRGTVLSQVPPAGTPVEAGGAVPLVLSAGPHPQAGPNNTVFVGGTCELTGYRQGICVGGPLFVALSSERGAAN